MSDITINATIVAPSTIRLIGRVLGALPAVGGGLKSGGDIAKEQGYQGQSQVFQAAQAGELRVAYIFAFSHEGRYTALHAPALFLVRGDGTNMVGVDGKVDPARLGLAQLDSNTTFASDLRFWAYDRLDQIIRLDLSSGTLQKLVVDRETGGAHGRRIDLVGQESSFSARLGQGSY
jgi:hypothetical protein